MTAWRDLKLNSFGDLAIENGDFVLLEGIDSIAQEINIAVQLWRGEYAFDGDLGIDWSALLSKGVADATISSALRKVIAPIVGVASVDKIEIVRQDNRTATISIAVTADTGATATVTTAVG